jgi:phosphoribosyl 1,2-cyclic phosphodiesterase
MKLTFLGTKGYIEAKTDRHRRHTSLLVEYRGKPVMVDCGEDWLGRLSDIRPRAVVVTHAHPDHARGLKEGALCPVYATEEAWEEMKDYPIADRRTLEPRKPRVIYGIEFEAYTVEHSLRAPAVGYRIHAGRVSIFYAPDLVYIREREEALSGVSLYIGDGATINRSFIRRKGDTLIGHAPISTQLTWCRKLDIPKAVITHCGSEIVKGDERRIGARLRDLGRKRGVEVRLAHDGMEMILR